MTGFSDPADPDNASEPGDEPAVEPMSPVEPTLVQPDDAGETAVPLQPTPDEHADDHQIVEPVDPREPAPDVNDGEAPQPMSGNDTA